MSLEILAYPFLFIALFFQSFVLVTLLSKPARAARGRSPLLNTSSETVIPSVAIIVPCWNEESTVAATCNSLLALDYPKEKLEIILVDDGSTDTTRNIMESFEKNKQIRILHKENGGKHTALNAGIALTKAELVGCLDADSFVEPDALREIITCFNNPKVVATTAAMSVHKPKNIIQHMQNADYSFGIIIRHTFASVNGLYVTPGPFSFYRRELIEKLGGFRYGNQVEDMEMALRIQRTGDYIIENAPHARVYTKTPLTISDLIKQRTRWISGFLRNMLGEYRCLIGSYKHGALGMIVLPTALLSIASGIIIFALMIFLFAKNIITALVIRSGIPLSYAFMPSGKFDWFYAPINFYIIIMISVIIISLSLMLAGKKISKTPGNLAPGLISYVFLYGFIAPLWLIRAVTDVTRGKFRGWRD